MSPLPALPLFLGSPRGTRAILTAAERLGQVPSPLCRCKDTAGFLEGAAEDCRGLPGTPGPRCLFGQRDVPGGRKPQLPGSHASRKAGNQKPRLPEAPSGGLVGPGSLWGTPLVLAWSSGRAIGWGEETGWSAARPGVSSNMGQLLKIAETPEVWGTEDCGSHRKVRTSTSGMFPVHQGWGRGGGPEAQVGGGQCRVGTSSSSRAPASSVSEDGQAAWWAASEGPLRG